MGSASEPVEVLRGFLQSLPQTKNIGTEVANQILPLLEKAWKFFPNSDHEKTFANKLYRAENWAWNPPLLTFTLERHGGTVNGSTRAELHHWEVDVQEGTAKVSKIGRRQLTPMSPRLDIINLVMETKDRIIRREKHESLKWVDDTHVVIVIGKIIPPTIAQTTTSRRRKFHTLLDQLMKEAGWKSATQR